MISPNESSADEVSRRTALKKGILASSSLAVGVPALSGTAIAGVGENRVVHYTLNNLNYDVNKGEKVADYVHDSSSYDNDGEPNGGLSVTKDGAVGRAFQFDGSDDYINVPDDSSLDIQEELTISFWFKLDGSSEDNQYPRAVSKGQSSTTNGAYSVFIEDGSGDPTRIGLRFIDSSGTKHDIDTGNTLTDYNDGNWHHVAATYSNSSDVGRLWFDGAEKVTESISGDVSVRMTEDDLHVGDGNGERHLNGNLDEVRVYNRALSAEDVQDLYDMKDD